MTLVRLIYLRILEHFGLPIFIDFYTFLHIFHSSSKIDRVMGVEAPSAPPTYQLSMLDQKNENMQKYLKIYEDGGANIFRKSYVNQPNQGHQPWQSNNLIPKAFHRNNLGTRKLFRTQGTRYTPSTPKVVILRSFCPQNSKERRTWVFFSAWWSWLGWSTWDFWKNLPPHLYI